MNYNILIYTIYLPVSIIITVWVANVLFRNGKLFLIDIFHGNQEIAHAVNQLLLVGFYLVNIGYVCVTMQETGDLTGARDFTELLVRKLGVIVLSLGFMHFLNLFIFFKLRRSAKNHKMEEVSANA